MELLQLIKKAFNHLPTESVLGESPSSGLYTNNTLGLDVNVKASIKLVKPRDIKKLLELAMEYNFVIQPISSGKNWGYGSIAANDQRDIVVLDLSKMNKIVPIDKELGLISVQPGVTQQQLYDYLTEKNWPHMTPVTGAGPMCSILSNALERGYGVTPHTDHFQAINKISAIIPNPKLWGKSDDEYIYESAVSKLDLSKDKFIDHTYKWGLGSYLDGIFSQSSMGIVTAITIRLARKPDAFASFYIKVSKKDKLKQSVEFIRNTLRDFEGIVGSINMMDKRRILSMVAENPNGKGKHEIMSPTQVEKLAKENNVAEWMIMGSIYGKKSVVKAVKRLIKSSAKFSDQIIFSDGLFIKFGRWLTRFIPYSFAKNIEDRLTTLEEGIQIMLGKPMQVAMPLAYWRNPHLKVDKSNLLNPDKDHCGLLWYAPLIPMNPDKIELFIEFVRNTTPKYKIEPLITFTNLKHDCIDATIPIIFDVKNPEALKNAHDCLDELFEEGRNLGFVPYRINIKHQKEKLNPNHMHWQLVKAIKEKMDPYNILAPNRYNPS